VYLGDDLKIKLRGPKGEVSKALLAEISALQETHDEPDVLPRFNAEFGQQLTDTGIVTDPARDSKGLEKNRAILQKLQEEWAAGKRTIVLKRELITYRRRVEKLEKDRDRSARDFSWQSTNPVTVGEPVIEMEGVVVKYGDKPILGNWKQKEHGSGEFKEGLWWTVKRGQRWGVFGPNGKKESFRQGSYTLLTILRLW